MKNKFIYIIIIFIISVLFFVLKNSSNKETKELPINVISTTPKNNSFFVSEKSEIIFTLSRSISNEEGQNIQVEIFPQIQLDKVYLNNKIRVSPATEFSLNTRYDIKIKYKENLIYTLNFETNPFTKEQIQEEGSKQTEGDLAFNESYDNFLKENPWYKDIPIEKEDYTIIYDFELIKFRVIMNRKITNEEERSKLIKKIVGDLFEIGVKSPSTKYTIQEIN